MIKPAHVIASALSFAPAGLTSALSFAPASATVAAPAVSFAPAGAAVVAFALSFAPAGAAVVAFALSFAPAGAAVAATPEPAPAPWRTAEEAALAPAQVAQLARARAAQVELASTLMKSLTVAIQADGHAAAIAVCSEAAPAVAKAVGASHQLRIGRTSAKLRSSQNGAPRWAADAVAGSTATSRIYLEKSGTLGYVAPILLAPPCAACHGAPDALAVGVAEALAKRYPEDRATGFAVGDLRGWFWVEVPPALTSGDPRPN